MTDSTGKSILLIDDNAKSNNHLARLFEAQGFTVYKANNGANGLALAKQHHPDVIFLDIEMPVLNGFEVLDKIREFQIPTRVAIISGHETGKAAIVKCIKGGACDYIFKPINFTELLAKVELWMHTENTINLNIPANLPIVEHLYQDIARLRGYPGTHHRPKMGM